MRIAIVSTPFISCPPRGYGGTELFCYELAEELHARRHDVTMFTTGESVVSCRKRALYHRAQWPPTPADEVNHTSWALAEVARGGFDLVHVNTPLAVPITRGQKTPIFCTIHHVREESLSRVYVAHPRVHYVAISERQRELEAPLPHVTVIHHGVAEKRYPPETAAGTWLAHVGRYAPEKGTHLAIDVARAAGIELRLGGRVHAPDRAYYDAEVLPRLGSFDGVRELGELDHDRKLEVLRGARALVCPLQWEEPFGLVAVEAMMCGTPVVGFARGSFPEIVDQGVTGFLVAPGDTAAMVDAVRALDGFDRAACAARARDRFSTGAMATSYERLFHDVVASHQFSAPRAA